MFRNFPWIPAILIAALASPAPAAEPVLDLPISAWSGVGPAGKDGARPLAVPGEAAFRFPDGPKGTQKHGFRMVDDSTSDWSDGQALRIGIELSDDGPVAFEVVLRTPSEEFSANVAVQGKGRHDIVLPRTAFEFEQARYAMFTNIKEVVLRAVEGKGTVLLRDAAALLAPDIALRAEIRGKSAAAGGQVTYDVEVSNCSREPQAITLGFTKYGWEGMVPSIAPALLSLAPGQRKFATVTVKVPKNVPPGGSETQMLHAIGNGASTATLRLVTTSRVPSPFILHTPARWQEVRDKVKKYDWAKKLADETIKQAEKWNVPEIARPPNNDPDDTYGPFLFKTQNELDLMACGTAWQLTGRKEFAEKVKTFLLRLSDPGEGYAKTLRACNQSFVQEGHFFQHVAMAYDMVADSGIFSQADGERIEEALRGFLKTVDLGNRNGAINNWNVSELTGALYCSLVLGDLASADRFFSGPSGIKDQLAKATMDDGWWYECSISYNVWCSTEFTQIALALEPFGINFKDMWLPASYAKEALLSAPGGAVPLHGGKTDSGDLNSRRLPFGMNKELWGPIRRPYRTIRDLWNSLIPFVDSRGVMPGINDSTERPVGGEAFDIAYYVWRDPAYAAMVELGDSRSLLYGIPDLPKFDVEIGKISAFADNVGLVQLRSQTKDCPPRDQISAALHYGTHGWAHGHFDRTNLLSLTRFGRSFYNPEMVWYGYEPFMYKFYVQTSVSKNMVVVDQKMQEATPGERLLFFSGQAMQAAIVETTARWSNPPYGGMVYDYVPVKTFAEKAWREGRFVPIPEKPPLYGSLTGYTEPIRQRRLMVVTDDYVLLADDLVAERKHTFESLFQMKGFLGLEAPQKKILRHDDQWNPDPIGSAQFVTDADWFSVSAPALARFRMLFGPGADNAGTRALESEDGPLNIDFHSLWPEQQEIMVAAVPEDHGVRKRLFYRILGDGKVLAEGKFGAWILGREHIDVPLVGVGELVLETRTELSQKPTLFWADAAVVTRDGKRLPLSKLQSRREALSKPTDTGEDYFGGPVKIAGKPFEETVAAEPEKNGEAGRIFVDLSGLDAARLESEIGGDYPLGDESQRRKTLAVRSPDAKSARFISVIEPHEGSAAVRKAVATGPDSVRVELADGRSQEIAFRGLDGKPSELSVRLVESRDGKVLREENATARK